MNAALLRRAAWAEMPIPALVIPSVLDASSFGVACACVERLRWERYALLDRASYDFASAVDELLPLLSPVIDVASETAGRALRIAEARVLRFLPGDYALVRHDRVHDDRPLELMLDLSPSVVAGAEVHYRHRGQVFFAFASAPGAVSLVERAPTVMCNHTYVSRRSTKEVIRLVALLRS